MNTCEIIVGDCLRSLRSIPDESVQCCVTSPPYWGLRDYGVSGQIGLEESFDEFLGKLVLVFDEVRRVLRADGVCWINMGDGYAGARGGGQGMSGQCADRSAAAAGVRVKNRSTVVSGLKPKDMIGQPWALAFALRNAGWWLRQDIIWHKPAPMPESVRDRCTKAHEYLFLLTKAAEYYWDFEAMQEPVTGGAHARVANGYDQTREIDTEKRPPGVTPKSAPAGGLNRANESFHSSTTKMVTRRNRRSVWTIPGEPFSGAHFATFPSEIPRRCILASTRPGDTVLDPFGGSGTTGMVALELGRNAILCELNPEYANMAKGRCNVTPGLPLCA